MAHKQHRGRRKSSGGGFLTLLLFVIALCVFCFSAFQLYRILGGYQKGRKEYDDIRDLALKGYLDDEDSNGHKPLVLDFDELLKVNPDTVGWIYFDPEPKEINYPMVQTDNNDLYLNKTFSVNENTVGAIFVNCYNHPDFNDMNTIIYGHRMRDNSMFHQLEKYAEEEFWKENQYFYIYTPDGREITYHIYSCGIVRDTSDSYKTIFNTPEEFADFIKVTKEAGNYDTGVEVATDDLVVTLSTCTKASDENRMVVRGVKESERIVTEPASSWKMPAAEAGGSDSADGADGAGN